MPHSVFAKSEIEKINQQINEFCELGIIKECEFVKDQFLSPIFTIPKKNGELRVILNLKELNKYIPYHHFKMDSFESAIKLVTKDCFMASLDLKHAYYSVPIAESQRKYLRFIWRGNFFEFSCLPMGIACAPRLFTKLMKPVYSTLRVMGHLSVGYIDDSLLISDTFEECVKNISDSRCLIERLGLVINEEKSVCTPSNCITFLGNVIDSGKMIVTLTQSRADTILEESSKVWKKGKCTIRMLARVIGLIVASFSAVEYGPLFYRSLEMDKIKALKENNGNFDAMLSISEKSKSELFWWIENVHSQKRIIDHGNSDIVITTDASTEGWGAVCDQCSAGGRWSLDEIENHINYLELLAIFLALKSFCMECSDIHVKIMTDNTCAKAYINNMGGIKSEKMNILSRKIWFWCMNRNIWISADHVPGKNNVADKFSREFNDSVEWKIEVGIFERFSNVFGIPEVDLFASRLNKQIDLYCSWKPDPDAKFINAFSFKWTGYYYAFPPFSLISRTLQKLRTDQAECLMVVPLWPTQCWYPVLMDLLIRIPLILPRGILSLPHSREKHPLHKKLTLIACRLSGKIWKCERFREKLQTSSWLPGDQVQNNNTQAIFENGFRSQIKGKLVQFKFL